MAKISIDVDELTKNLKERALNARNQFQEFAKKAQKDLSQKEVLKRLDQIVTIVKSNEFMKNPKVAELTKKVITLSEQLEKTVSKNANQFVDQVKARIAKSGATKKSKKTSSGSGAAKKTSPNGKTTTP